MPPSYQPALLPALVSITPNANARIRSTTFRHALSKQHGRQRTEYFGPQRKLAAPSCRCRQLDDGHDISQLRAAAAAISIGLSED